MLLKREAIGHVRAACFAELCPSVTPLFSVLFQHAVNLVWCYGTLLGKHVVHMRDRKNPLIWAETCWINRLPKFSGYFCHSLGSVLFLIITVRLTSELDICIVPTLVKRQTFGICVPIIFHTKGGVIQIAVDFESLPGDQKWRVLWGFDVKQVI